MRKDRLKIKFSPRCAVEGYRKEALRWEGKAKSYDSYCRTHKRENAAAYMRKKRSEARAQR